MALAGEKEPTAAATFPEPWGFLDSFEEEGAPYEGLYTFLADELEFGAEDVVRGYFSERALDVEQQGDVTLLLDRFLELTEGPRAARVGKSVIPISSSAINYLKFRLAVGVMEPAIDVALDRTDPEHTRVRGLRSIVAANLTRELVNDTFSGATLNSRKTGFFDREAESYVKQRFVGAYGDAKPEVLDKFLDSGFVLPRIEPDEDDFRIFDLRDLSEKAPYAILKSGRPKKGAAGRDVIFPTTDEMDAMAERNRASAAASYANGGWSQPPAQEQRWYVGDRHVVRSTIGQIFRDLGLLSTVEGLNLTPAERFIPGRSFRGRVVAREVVNQLLEQIEKKEGEVHRVFRNGTKQKAPAVVTEEVRARLITLQRMYEGEEMPADALIILCDEDYVAKYGEPTTRRDFWDD